jgi:high-affinity nickel permease
VHGVDLVLRVAVGGRPHLAVFGAFYGLLGGGRGVVIVAYLLGMKWAVDPGNAAAIGGGTRRLSGIGRRSVSSGFWFALGFATTVAGLAFLFTMGAQLFALRDLRLAPAVFLGILAIVQVVVLIGAVRARRDGGGPVPRPGLERLIRWMRRAWQLYPVGALCGVAGTRRRGRAARARGWDGRAYPAVLSGAVLRRRHVPGDGVAGGLRG